MRVPHLVPPFHTLPTLSLVPRPELTGPFGSEAVLLWHAMLTRKCILVYAPAIAPLLTLMRSAASPSPLLLRHPMRLTSSTTKHAHHASSYREGLLLHIHLKLLRHCSPK